MNITILQGCLGADPELRFTQSGQAVMKMRLCTTDTYLDKNKVRQETNEWHNVTVWNKRAEALAKILIKGSRILVRGRLHYGSYEDKENIKRYTTEIVADDIELLGGKRKAGGGDDDRSSSSSSNNSSSSSSSSSKRRDDRKPDSDSGRDDGGGFDDPDSDIPFIHCDAGRMGPERWWRNR
jgi:single-strand DNA-binding protein